jgi:hypothetical protein
MPVQYGEKDFGGVRDGFYLEEDCSSHWPRATNETFADLVLRELERGEEEADEEV